MIIQEYKKHKESPKDFADAIVDRITKLYQDSPEKFTADKGTKISDYCENVHKNLVAANKPEKQTIGAKIINKIRLRLLISILIKIMIQKINSNQSHKKIKMLKF